MSAQTRSAVWGAVMLPFQWNALRVGDRVMVHDDLDPDLALHHGVVRIVQTRQSTPNEIGIRLDSPPSVLLQPWRHAVHLMPMDRGSSCWRCAAMSDDPIDDDRGAG